MDDWDQILDDFGPTIWKLTLRMLGNTADAADCFQVVMLEAFEASKRQTIRQWGAFLRRLAIRACLDRLRVRYRDRKDPRPIEEMTIPARASAADRSIDRQHLASQLRIVLARLPENQAEAFSLRWIDELSNEEVAKRMGVTTNHVGVLLHRARTALRSLLKDEREYRL